MTPERARCLEALARLILRVERPHPVRVAIDGPDAAGKTILADELAPLLERSGRPVVRASVDGFHRPRAERYARGPESAEGYYFDSFDYPALRAALLDPLGAGGDRRQRRSTARSYAGLMNQRTNASARPEIGPSTARSYAGLMNRRTDPAATAFHRPFIRWADEPANERVGAARNRPFHRPFIRWADEPANGPGGNGVPPPVHTLG